MSISSHSALREHAVKCELAGEVLRSSGMLRLRVTGWSMLPAVWPGDTLVVESAASDAVADGDIVLFGRDRRLFAHRVISQSKMARSNLSQLLTRGDSMPQTDPPVAADELLGKVSHIIRNGKCIEPTRSLSFSERAVAALVRHSQVAARVVVGVHGLRQAFENQIVEEN
jgi:signal peptidase